VPVWLWRKARLVIGALLRLLGLCPARVGRATRVRSDAVVCTHALAWCRLIQALV
jgi:hypothetical protein